MDKGVLKDFVKSQREMQRDVEKIAKEHCRALLKEKKGHEVRFLNDDDDPDTTDLPCTNVANNCCTDDVVSANIKAVRLDKDGYIHVDLDYYYQQDSEDDLMIENDEEFSWLELLDWLAV